MRCSQGFPIVSGKYPGGAENQDKASLSHLVSACPFSHAYHTSLRRFCFGLTDTLLHPSSSHVQFQIFSPIKFLGDIKHCLIHTEKTEAEIPKTESLECKLLP